MAWDKAAERDQLSAEIAALESETTLQLRERWKAVPIQNLNPDVSMMQPAEDRYRCDAAKLLSSSKIWSIFIQ
jgi:hypothetical protein